MKIPEDPEALTAGWLNRALAAGGADGGKIDSVEVEDYSFDSCLRDYRLMLLVRLIVTVVNGGRGRFTDAQEEVIFRTLMPRLSMAILDHGAGELAPR